MSGARKSTFMLYGIVAALALLALAGLSGLIARAGDDAITAGRRQTLDYAFGRQRAIFVDSANRLAGGISAVISGDLSLTGDDLNRLLWPTSNTTQSFQKAYLLDDHRAVVSAFPVDETIRPEVTGAIDHVLPTDQAGRLDLAWSEDADSESERFSTALTLDGIPYLMTAVPLRHSRASDEPHPSLLVILKQIDLRILGVMERNSDLHDLQLVFAKPPQDTSLALVSRTGATVGWFTWQPDHVVGRAFQRALPYLALISALLIAMLAAAARSAFKVNRMLAERERATRHAAEHDALTGLTNRSAFKTVLERRLRLAGSMPTAVLYLDLDGFKEINDTLGHAVGDDLLVEVADRLRKAVRKQGVLARLGGDEFALLMPTIGSIEARTMGECLVGTLARPLRVGEADLSIRVSVGVAISPQDGLNVADLLRRADIALYEAKRLGGAQVVLFAAPLEDAIRNRKNIEQDLPEALARGELSLVYQPIFASDGQRMVAVEALMRWHHPERGFVPPPDFIARAEASGFILRLGAWALERACWDAKAWGNLSVAVNLSPVQICSPGLCALVTDVLARTGFAANKLVLEVTEGVLIEHQQQALAVISNLQALGVRVALDDFGTGYSSLAYLKRFSFNKLKIDRSFVESLGQSADDAIIVHAIVSLGRGLGMTVVAEGVETVDQHRLLQATGCHEFQGFLFARPMPAAAITDVLSEKQLVA